MRLRWPGKGIGIAGAGAVLLCIALAVAGAAPASGAALATRDGALETSSSSSSSSSEWWSTSDDNSGPTPELWLPSESAASVSTGSVELGGSGWTLKSTLFLDRYDWRTQQLTGWDPSSSLKELTAAMAGALGVEADGVVLGEAEWTQHGWRCSVTVLGGAADEAARAQEVADLLISEATAEAMRRATSFYLCRVGDCIAVEVRLEPALALAAMEQGTPVRRVTFDSFQLPYPLDEQQPANVTNVTLSCGNWTLVNSTDSTFNSTNSSGFVNCTAGNGTQTNGTDWQSPLQSPPPPLPPMPPSTPPPSPPSPPSPLPPMPSSPLPPMPPSPPLPSPPMPPSPTPPMPPSPPPPSPSMPPSPPPLNPPMPPSPLPPMPPSPPPPSPPMPTSPPPPGPPGSSVQQLVSAALTLNGMNASSFGASEQTAFICALAAEFGVQVSAVNITSLVEVFDGSPSRRLLQVNAVTGLTVAFTVLAESLDAANALVSSILGVASSSGFLLALQSSGMPVRSLLLAQSPTMTALFVSFIPPPPSPAPLGTGCVAAIVVRGIRSDDVTPLVTQAFIAALASALQLSSASITVETVMDVLAPVALFSRRKLQTLTRATVFVVSLPNDAGCAALDGAVASGSAGLLAAFPGSLGVAVSTQPLVPLCAPDELLAAVSKLILVMGIPHVISMFALGGLVVFDWAKQQAALAALSPAPAPAPAPAPLAGAPAPEQLRQPLLIAPPPLSLPAHASPPPPPRLTASAPPPPDALSMPPPLRGNVSELEGPPGSIAELPAVLPQPPPSLPISLTPSLPATQAPGAGGQQTDLALGLGIGLGGASLVATVAAWRIVARRAQLQREARSQEVAPAEHATARHEDVHCWRSGAKSQEEPEGTFP